MVITRLEKNRSKNYSVYVDDKIAFEITEYALFKLDVHIGKELNEKELDLIRNQVLISIAQNDAISFVSYKMRTTHEVELKLKEKYAIEIIEEVVDYLNQNGYLNDEIYAEKFIIEKKRLEKLSKKVLMYKLLGKGISKSIIEEKISQLEYDESEYAKKLVSKFSKAIKEKEPFKTEGYLYRKGFSKDTIKSVIKEETNQDGD